MGLADRFHAEVKIREMRREKLCEIKIDVKVCSVSLTFIMQWCSPVLRTGA